MSIPLPDSLRDPIEARLIRLNTSITASGGFALAAQLHAAREQLVFDPRLLASRAWKWIGACSTIVPCVRPVLPKLCQTLTMPSS